MNRHEFTDSPTALRIIASDRTDPQRAHDAAQTLLRRAEAEIERLEHVVCSLLLHDGLRDGRVGKPRLAQGIVGERGDVA